MTVSWFKPIPFNCCSAEASVVLVLSSRETPNSFSPSLIAALISSALSSSPASHFSFTKSSSFAKSSSLMDLAGSVSVCGCSYICALSAVCPGAAQTGTVMPDTAIAVDNIIAAIPVFFIFSSHSAA